MFDDGMPTSQQCNALLHAIQSAVAYELQAKGADAAGCSPKHLRVGVNNALIEHGAIVTLLIEKGVFTEAEYIKAYRDALMGELKRYEDLNGGLKFV